MFKHWIQDVITLFVVIDPVGLVPLFIALTQHKDPSDRRQIALLGVSISALILVAFIVAGQPLLNALEIGLPAFRIAGGIVLMIIGLQMILGQELKGEASSDPESLSDLAVFPLAMPLIAGPGGIMTVVLLTDNAKFSIPEQAATTSAVLAVLIVTYILLLAADWIQRLLGTTGTNVVTRVLGLLLAALASETILDGIRGFFDPTSVQIASIIYRIFYG